MKKIQSTIVPEILAIKHPKSMDALQYFSIGELLNKDVFDVQNNKVNFDINIVKNPMDFWEGEKKQFSTYFTINDTDIYYERRYLGLKFKMLIKDITADNITVYVNKSYLRFVKLKMDNLYPVGVHLLDVFLLNILRKGDLVIHAASLHNTETNDSFLILAPPDTGKTYSTAMLVKKGMKFVGEDLSYYNAETDSLVCVPYTSTWGHHFSSKKFDVTQWPIIGWFFTERKEIVTDLFGDDSVIRNSKLSRIYLIEKADENSIEKVEYNDEFLRKLIVVQRNEFTYFKNMLLRAFEYINGGDIDRVMDKEDESLKEVLQNKELYIVKGKRYDDFYKLIYENEKNL